MICRVDHPRFHSPAFAPRTEAAVAGRAGEGLDLKILKIVFLYSSFIVHRMHRSFHCHVPKLINRT